MTESRGKALVYVDTNIFIDLVKGQPQQRSRLSILFERFELAPGTAVTSEFTLAEILGRNAPGLEWSAQKAFYLGLLVLNNFIDLRPITRDILIETGEFRYLATERGRPVKLPDAIHLVTAVQARCRYFLSSDRRITAPDPLRTILPDVGGLAEIHAALDA